MRDVRSLLQNSSVNSATEVTYISYEQESYTVKQGRTFKTHRRLSHTTDMRNFLQTIFPAMMQKYILHSHLYKIQNKAVDDMLDHISPKLLPHVLVWAFDYSRNPELLFEKMVVEQVKDRPQITLGPLLSYHVKAGDGDKLELEKTCTFYISNDNQHKTHMSMSIFERQCERQIEGFKNEIGSDEKMCLIVVSDGSPTELKNVELFNFWSKVSQKFDITVSLVYFAAAHGKFQYDPEGGLWKFLYRSECVRALKEESTNLTKIAEWFNTYHVGPRSGESAITKRETLVHGSVKQSNSVFKSVKGSSLNHNFLFTGVAGNLYMRKAFCFQCENCKKFKFLLCTNDQIPAWTRATIKRK